MNAQQKQQAAALAKSAMIRTMTDAELARQYYATKAQAGEEVMHAAVSEEMSRRGRLMERMRSYFASFRVRCTDRQLLSISRRFESLGSLAIMAESELVARDMWGEQL